MIYEIVRVVLDSGEIKDVSCPDQRVNELPKGSYVAATCGYPATHTVLSKGGKALGWIAAEDSIIGLVD